MRTLIFGGKLLLFIYLFGVSPIASKLELSVIYRLLQIVLD